MTVPPAQQCTLPSCEREAVNPLRRVALCESHLEEVEGGEPDSPPETSGCSETPRESETGSGRAPAFTAWSDADFATPETGVWAPERLECQQWMGHVEKKPFAPWADRDHPEADADGDARWKWGLEENYVDGETVAMAEDDPRLDGRAFLQRADDPYAYVDGDDVRDPETGAVHPAFVAILEHLGLTYADVSQSGAGVHAVFRGELPDGVKQASWRIDADPWGANDDLPSIEIYDGKRVCVETGQHVPGTPTDVREWDADGLEALLEANDQLPRERDRDRDVSVDRDDYDLDDYDPGATTSSETTSDVRDVFAAIDRLDAQRVAERTIVDRWNDDASTSDGERAFWPTWGSRSDSGTANIANAERWQDTGELGGYGGPVTMAAIDAGVISPRNARPVDGQDWWRGVEHLRELGFDIPEHEPEAEHDADPTAALPIGRLDALPPEDRRRYAKQRGLDWPDTDEARERLRDAIFRELRASNATVLDAPTALGKSHTVATEPWRRRAGVTGEQPVVHLHATTDARDEAHAASQGASGVSTHVLKGRTERCPLAAGVHDPAEDADAEDAPDVAVTVDGQPASEFFDRLCDEKGLPFSTAHALAREHNDQDLEELPCREEHECPAIAQWEGVPRDEEGDAAVDVLHATNQFAYVPSLRRGTNVVLDEQPDFAVELDQDRIRRMVGAFLREIDAPVATWEEFVTLATVGGADTDAAAERDALDERLDRSPGREWYLEEPDAHALAPDLTRSIWRALRHEEPDDNGRRSWKVMHQPPRLDVDEDGYAATWLSVVIDEEFTVRSVRNVPDFTQARAVVGLDAHPSMPMWELNGAPGMVCDAVLEPEERALWRRYERGLRVVQVGDATRPRSGSKAREWMNDERVRAVVERIREHADVDLATAIAPQQVEPAVRRVLQEAGADDVETMHYGEEKSRNDFADEPVGYCYGCMDPGDEMILDAIAELGLEATPSTAETDAGETVREKGRTFGGADADTAAAVLASVRENHVAQAAGRYARNPDDPESEAVVYLHTDAAPTGFVDEIAPGVEWLATETQRAVIDELAARPSATLRELADAVGCSKEHVRETLRRLEERGDPLVERREGSGEHGADVWRDAGVDGALVNLGETASDPLQECSRWSLAIRPPTPAEERDTSASDVEVGGSTWAWADAAGADPPPDGAD